MIYLKLFLNFLLIGTISFGGGYGMISIIQDIAINNNWLTSKEFIDFIAICESTPGSLAINMATFIGTKQAGLLGAIVSTIGVVIPSFIIILLIVTIIKNYLNNKYLNKFLQGVRPAIVALIIVAALKMFPDVFIDNNNLDYKSILIFIFLLLITKLSKNKLSPIIIIIISAILGIILY